MTPQIYWLASYPKSGNTWMRILLTNYLRNADEPADINALDGGPIASARQVFDDNVGVEASDLTQDEIERYRPGVYEMISAKAMEQTFLKVHDAYSMTPYGVPLFPISATAGVLYIVRNPLDVAVSFANYSGKSLETIVKFMGDDHAALVDSSHRLNNQLRQRLLSWRLHATSWVDLPSVRVHLLRYEDLLSDPIATFTEVIRFCNLDDDSRRIAKAVEFSRFERLQKQEEEAGFRESLSQNLSGRFFRRGLAGAWQDELSEALAAQVIADQGDVMRRFGYLA